MPEASGEGWAEKMLLLPATCTSVHVSCVEWLREDYCPGGDVEG